MWEPTAIIAAIADTSSSFVTVICQMILPSSSFLPTHNSDNVPLCHHNSVYSRFGCQWLVYGIYKILAFVYDELTSPFRHVPGPPNAGFLYGNFKQLSEFE